MYISPLFLLVPLVASLVSADPCFSYGNTSIPCVKLCLQASNLTLIFNSSNITVPSNATVTGVCSNVSNDKQNYSKLELSWERKGESDWLEFEFLLNTRSTGRQLIGAKHDWYLHKITYNTTSHSNRSYASLGSYQSISASDVFSYACDTFSANLTRNATSDNFVVLQMWNYQVQAFVLQNGTFSVADHCLGPGLPYYVPLSVGGALLVLFLVPFVVRFVWYVLGPEKGRAKIQYTILESEPN